MGAFILAGPGDATGSEGVDWGIHRILQQSEGVPNTWYKTPEEVYGGQVLEKPTILGLQKPAIEGESPLYSARGPRDTACSAGPA